MPTFVSGSVFPPIPLRMTVGTLYSLHDLISVSKDECPMETEPQESSLTSTWVFEYLPDSEFRRLLFKRALQISLVPGFINLASSM